MGAASLFGRAGAAVAVLAACLFAGATPARSLEPRLKAQLARLPLYFAENRGQAPPSVAYSLQGRDKTLFFTARGVTFLLDTPSAGGYALRLDFLGANRHVRPRGAARTPAVVSYFKGQLADWRTGIPTYSRLVYEDLWPGIDLVFTGTVERMKYSFLVRPGADPRGIRLAYRGATRVAVNARGELEVETPAGGFHDGQPISFQSSGGKRVEIPTAYDLDKTTSSYGLRLGAYDPHLPLLIDPEIFLYAGFLGGSGGELAWAVAVDAAGNAYIAGSTNSAEASFPDGDGFGALPGFDTTPNGGQGDAFVAKVNATGTALLYAGYIGGSDNDGAHAIAVDAAGNAYIAGTTVTSFDSGFPDGNGFGALVGPDTTPNGVSDAFVAKINAAGTALLYAGYIGGEGSDSGDAIAVDASGNAYVAGGTKSSVTFPDGDGIGVLPGPDPTFNGDSFGGEGDAFVAKVNPAGTGLLYAGYIGGAGTDQARAIALDEDGNAYVAGRTTSSEATFPDGDGFGSVTGPDVTHNNLGFSFDAFVAKVDVSGTALLYAGYIGGGGVEDARGIAVDAAGSAYIAGATTSAATSFPDGDGLGALPGPDPSFNGGADGYVVKLSPSGSAFLYAGYIGGSGVDSAKGVAVNGTGHAFVAGETSSTEATFPDGDGFDALSGPDPTYNGGPFDAFVVEVTPAGAALLFASYIGGSEGDAANAIALDSTGNAYIAGLTTSAESTFPDGDGLGGLPSFDSTANGSQDAFLVKIGQPAALPEMSIPGLRPQGIMALVLLLSAAGLFVMRRAA